jgi:antitoxin ParD1/3/4
MSNGETVTVELGAFAGRVRELVDSGAYDSPSEVVQAGLEALEREQADWDEVLRQKIREAYDDPRPGVPAEEAFARLRARHAGRARARGC